jgi:predicted amidophosphoribosyltransferase
VLDRLLALIVPPACLACRAPLARAGEPLCGACRAALPWLPARTCRRCGLPPPCGPCPARAAAFTRAWAPLAHDGPARELVRALKFRGGLAAVDVMAAHIAANAPPRLLRGATLVPVPAHRARRRERGFDQAERIAGALARRTGLPVSGCLERGGAAGRQVGASRARRWARGRLDVRCRGPAPAVALLVDDVHTTGATLDACARALRAGGARRVAAVTYTRALP